MRKEDNAAWVIKIGGSLYNSKYLTQWLHTISKVADRKILIVPGGGPFADQVRHADEKFNLCPDHSHNMAVMAMQQYGHLFASLCPEFVLAGSKEKLDKAWKDKKIAIWEPYELVRDQCTLAKSWQVTSDSLAVWVSNLFEIGNVLLVKSSKQVLEITSLDKLKEKECIDATVQSLLEQYQINLQIIHKSQVDNLPRFFN